MVTYPVPHVENHHKIPWVNVNGQVAFNTWPFIPRWLPLTIENNNNDFGIRHLDTSVLEGIFYEASPAAKAFYFY